MCTPLGVGVEGPGMTCTIAWVSIECISIDSSGRRAATYGYSKPSGELLRRISN